MLLDYLRHLPYGRSSVRGQLDLVISEGKGTCSSKHALIASVANEQGWDDIELILCVYKMHKGNTPGIGDVLDNSAIDYIPEAHCYVNIGQSKVDITSKEANIDRIEADILIEQAIIPDQVGGWKVEFHKNYIKEWLEIEQNSLDFDQIWGLRESAIYNLEN